MSENIPDLSNKIALVTGASRGIGRACAMALAKAGAHVLAVGRTSGALEELDDEIKAAGGVASLIPLDLTEGDAVEHMAAALMARFEKLDIFIGNAASLGELAPVPDIDAKVWRQTLDLNLTVNWRLLRALDPMLRKSENARVLFMTSRVGGEYARAFWGAYAVSKAGLEMLARTYADETASAGISVGVIDPGAMRTGMRAAAMPGEDPATLPAPEEIAPLLYHAVTNKPVGFQRYVFRDWKSNV